jgi:hypothetical protein
MTEDEIKAAATRVFDALLKGTVYESNTPEYVAAADAMTKVFRHHYIELIAGAIRGQVVKGKTWSHVSGSITISL